MFLFHQRLTLQPGQHFLQDRLYTERSTISDAVRLVRMPRPPIGQVLGYQLARCVSKAFAHGQDSLVRPPPFLYDVHPEFWMLGVKPSSKNASTSPPLPTRVTENLSDALGQLSWDDLRIIKTLSECGNRATSAKRLGINVSTVSRRVAQVEKTLGVALFDHRRSGYMLTPEGIELRALAERVELDIVSVTRRVSRTGQGLLGKLRITTSDSLLLYFLTPIIADFKALNEGIAIEVLVGNETLSLARDESDIAVRATKKPSESLVGRKLASIAWAPYGSIKQATTTPFAGGQQWVSYSAGLCGLKAKSYVEDRVSADCISYRTDSVAAASVAIAAGLGYGFLPCMLGDITPGLTRVGPVVRELQDELWLLTHQDIRKSWRVKAFMTFCAAAVAHQKPLIEGQLNLPVAQGETGSVS